MVNEALCKEVNGVITASEKELWEIRTKIYENPELGYSETLAHETICSFFESLGSPYEVKRSAFGLETAFEISYTNTTGSGASSRTVAYNAEYDALPGIGHACGHHLIATSAIAAFLATVAVMQKEDIRGKALLLGTPAEESFGGKIDLIHAGAYKNVDACLMTHPISRGSVTMNDGLTHAGYLARQTMTVTYEGRTAHAGAAPWAGKNALDAVVSAYVNVSMLRQQIHPSQRVHGVIKNGGDRPNVIPGAAQLEYYARAKTAAECRLLCQRLRNCFEAAALATECEVDIKEGSFYKDVRTNKTIGDIFNETMSSFSREYTRYGPVVGGSTDQGNVSYEVPSLHSMFAIDDESAPVAAAPHHPDFRDASGSRLAFERAMDCSKGMAVTGLEILKDAALAAQMKKEFDAEFAES